MATFTAELISYLSATQKGGHHEENCSGPCGHVCIDRHPNAGANLRPAVVIEQQPAEYNQYTAAETKQPGAAFAGLDFEFLYTRQQLINFEQQQSAKFQCATWSGDAGWRRALGMDRTRRRPFAYRYRGSSVAWRWQQQHARGDDRARSTRWLV